MAVGTEILFLYRMEEANDRFVRYIHHMQILKDAKLSRGRFDNEINV